jgi:hypothetical protein
VAICNASVPFRNLLPDSSSPFAPGEQLARSALLVAAVASRAFA